jgi:hypothetical protein
VQRVTLPEVERPPVRAAGRAGDVVPRGELGELAGQLRKLSLRNGSAAVRLATASAKIAPNGRFASSDRT